MKHQFQCLQVFFSTRHTSGRRRVQKQSALSNMNCGILRLVSGKYMQPWSLCHLLIPGSETSVQSSSCNAVCSLSQKVRPPIQCSPQPSILCPQLLSTSAVSLPLTRGSLCGPLPPRDYGRMIPGSLACDCYLFAQSKSFSNYVPLSHDSI